MPLEQSGEIKHKDFRIKYVLTRNASAETVLDFLILEEDGFPPVHRRIEANGEIKEPENFEFSLMYETSQEREEQEIRMKNRNRKIVELIIEKGLSEPDEEWIGKYL